MFLLVRLAVMIAINALALWIANILWDSVSIHGFWAYFIGALVLGIANAVIKPILALLTLPLIVLTLGLFYLLINIVMVALAEWIAPNFSIDGFWTYVGTLIVIWLVNYVAGQIFGDLDARRRRFSLT
jgi:putative membrane protein